MEGRLGHLQAGDTGSAAAREAGGRVFTQGGSKVREVGGGDGQGKERLGFWLSSRSDEYFEVLDEFALVVVDGDGFAGVGVSIAVGAVAIGLEIKIDLGFKVDFVGAALMKKHFGRCVAVLRLDLKELWMLLLRLLVVKRTACPESAWRVHGKTSNGWR
ncbi:hypothetical protein Ct61P_15103 [Colletotrichum tofieldiae]|nr:hypothetical protein Ct61P_15103 [Colletotrichum tofieldiae]